MIISVIVRVAFLTLLERKRLRYIQLRKGPNKVSLMGVCQPFCDAIKLFTKEFIYPLSSNYLIYYFSPVISLFLSLFIWLRFPFIIKLISFKIRILFIFCCLRLGVYPLIVAGWSSNSIYALLGRLRAVAQTISYEVRLIFIFLCFIFLHLSLNLIEFSLFQIYSWFFFICIPLRFIIIISFLAETNRSPFDFAEGESELVSGFNIEYGRGGFALIFLAEYARILFIRIIFSVLFLGGYRFYLIFFFKLFFISFFYIWVRAAYPRFRYDKLIYLTWKSYLPVSLNFLFFFLGLKIFFFI